MIKKVVLLSLLVALLAASVVRVDARVAARSAGPTAEETEQSSTTSLIRRKRQFYPGMGMYPGMMYPGMGYPGMYPGWGMMGFPTLFSINSNRFGAGMGPFGGGFGGRSFSMTLGR